MAHAGVLAEVGRDHAGSGRFGEVRDAARAVAGGRCAGKGEAGEGEDGLRFYGGFAFRDEHRADGVWEGFPAALFHLPAVELVGDGRGAGRLTLRVAVPDDPDDGGVARARDAAERAAGELVDRLAVGGGAAVVRDEPMAAERVETDRVAWERAVEETLDAIAAGRIRKAVLARTLDVTPPVPVDPVDVALALWSESPGSHVFLFEPVPGRSLVGAAPETVATLRGTAFHATAVAGSIRRGGSEEERRALARRLLESRKDRAEQEVVVEDVVRRLGPLVEEVRAQEEPHVLTLARIQHLETVVRARTAPGRHVLELVEALHPTPAVCGVPRDEALAFLAEEEPFERGWYAGPVGWFDSAGDGILVPALRSAVVAGRPWRLYAGAGIVAGSDPALEWEETGIKFEPVLRALEAAGLRT